MAATLGSLMMLESSQTRLKQRIHYQRLDGHKILAARSLQILFGNQDSCSQFLGHISALPGQRVLFSDSGTSYPAFQSLSKTWRRLSVQQLELSVTGPPAADGNLAILSATLDTGKIQLPIYYRTVDDHISFCVFSQGSDI
jgi:hypothetical protein